MAESPDEAPEEGQTEEKTAEDWLQTEIEETGPCKKHIKATVAPSKVKEEMKTAYGELRQNVAVPGFRKGRAPVKLLERRFGKEVREQVQQDLTGEGFRKIMEDAHLQLVGDPEFGEIELADDDTMTFQADVEVRPEFEIGEYKGLKLKKPSEDVKDADVEESIEVLRKQRAELVTEEGRKTKEGDTVLGEMVISVGDEVLREEREMLMPVQKSTIMGVEVDLPAILKQAAAGDEKTVSIDLPENFAREEFAGKKADMKITVREVKVQQLPEVNDEFAGMLGFDNIDAMREEVRRHTESMKKSASRDALETQIFDNLLEKTDFEVPEGLLAKEEDRFREDMRRRMRYRGVPLKVIDKRLEELGGSTREESTNRIKAGFIIDAVAEKEKIAATEDEVAKLIETLASDYGQKAEDVQKRMEEAGRIPGLRTQIRREKTVQFILDNARITEEK